MFQAIRDKISYVVENNLILEHLLCGSNWRQNCLSIPMCPLKMRLCALGYGFNEENKLRRLICCCFLTDMPFDINTYGPDPKQRLECYQYLRHDIGYYVYQSLLSYHDMIPLSVPRGFKLGHGTFIFVTRDYDKNDVLLILIPGSGDVRAGQWSRNAILTEGLNEGSQIPYVEKAKERGYGVMVLNPMDNQKRSFRIPHSGSPKEHGRHVWDAYIKRTKATKILIVAHAYGGIVTSCLANIRKWEFEERVAGVALIDSLHMFSEHNVTTFFKKVSKHWVTHDTPLDTPLPSHYFDVTKVSSGHSRLGVTPYSCMNSVFDFFEEKLSIPQVITQQVRST